MTQPADAPAAFRLLTVCVGNICRSPLAERLLAERLADSVEARRVSITSAGIRGLSGRPMEDRAAAELVRLGGQPGGFVARRITAEIALGTDLVLAMTREVRAEVLKEQPRAMKRTFTLLEFAALCRLAVEQDAAVFTTEDLIGFAARHRSHAAHLEQDVPDPIGRSVQVHREVADLIASQVGVVSALLAPLLRE